MKKLSKVVLIIIASLMSVAIVYLSVGSPDIDIERIALTYNNLSTKQAFYQYTKEDWIDYVEYVQKEQEEVEEKVPTPTKNNYASYGNHNHVAWRQKNFKDKIGPHSNIADHGCGFCSLTSMMAELNPQTCASMSPSDWLSVLKNNGGTAPSKWGYKDKNGVQHGGMTYAAIEAWVADMNSLNKYGKYKVVEYNSSSSDISAAALSAIKDYAVKPEFVVVLSTGTGTKDCVFTNDGHIILAVDAFEENGEWYFHVDDSSARAAGRVKQNWEDMKNYNWKLDADADYNGYKYRIKGYWVIMRES